MKRDIIFSFIGGVVIGVAGTVFYMKRTGYVKLTEREKDILGVICDDSDEMQADSKSSIETPLRDTPSFTTEKTIDTHKVSYDGIITKPSLDEVSKKYQDESFDRHMAEREHPEEDEEEFDETEDPDYEGPIYGDEDPEERELADAMVDEDEDQDYGHVIKQLPARRKKDIIYLVPQDYAGEIYLLEDLLYYAKDDVLCDVTDAPVDDPMSVIGDSLGYFGQYGADSDKLFVRNCTIGIEYEVTLIDGRYADHLYGVNSEEMEAELDKTRKGKKARRDDVE